MADSAATHWLQSASDGITIISNSILSYALVLAASGALTMALLEAWKKFFGTQAKFHRKSILKWLKNEQENKHEWMGTKRYRVQIASKITYDPARAYQQLLFLTTGLGGEEQGNERFQQSMEDQGKLINFYRPSIEYALFELEIEQLMGQMQDATDIALNNSDIYPDFFHFITRGAREKDVLEWKKSALDIVNDPKKGKQIANLYTRLKQVIRRHLDSFQIVTTHRWNNGNQFAAGLLGCGVLLAAQCIAHSHSFNWGMFISSIIGGMLAPIAKNLVEALQKVKRD